MRQYENIQAPWIGRDPSWYDDGFCDEEYFDAHADDGDYERDTEDEE